MEKFQLNTEARQLKIKIEFDACMLLIASNLGKGISKTDLYIDKEIAADVKELIEKKIEDSRLSFEIVRTGNNPYTGRPESYYAETVGDQRHYRIAYN